MQIKREIDQVYALRWSMRSWVTFSEWVKGMRCPPPSMTWTFMFPAKSKYQKERCNHCQTKERRKGRTHLLFSTHILSFQSQQHHRYHPKPFRFYLQIPRKPVSWLQLDRKSEHKWQKKRKNVWIQGDYWPAIEQLNQLELGFGLEIEIWMVWQDGME